MVGGVLVFQSVHVCTTGTRTPEIRAAWFAKLNAISARNSAVVVAGHMAPDAATDLSGVALEIGSKVAKCEMKWG